RERIEAAVPAPLSRFEAAMPSVEGEVVFMCRTGRRTGMNCVGLAERAPGAAYVLEGGLEGWKAAGLPTARDRKAPLELMRQVQMTAGGLILAGAGLGILIHPGFWGLSAIVGAGLFLAGAT